MLPVLPTWPKRYKLQLSYSLNILPNAVSSCYSTTQIACYTVSAHMVQAGPFHMNATHASEATRGRTVLPSCQAALAQFKSCNSFVNTMGQAANIEIQSAGRSLLCELVTSQEASHQSSTFSSAATAFCWRHTCYKHVRWNAINGLGVQKYYTSQPKPCLALT